MDVCPRHEEVVRRLERAVAAVEAQREDLREIKRDVKSLLAANGARREAIGELRGRVLTWSVLVATALSAVVSLAVAIITRR